MHGVADVQLLHIDHDGMRDIAGRAVHFDVVAHDVQHAAALDAGRQAFVREVDGHMHAHPRCVGDAHEIRMDRAIGHGIELHVARQHPVGVAADLEVEQRGVEALLVELAVDFPRIEGDQHGALLVAVDNAGDVAFASRRAGGPLSGPVPLVSGNGVNFGHWSLLRWSDMETASRGAALRVRRAVGINSREPAMAPECWG